MTVEVRIRTETGWRHTEIYQRLAGIIDEDDVPILVNAVAG